MAVTGFPWGCRELTLAARAIAPKVSFLAPPRTHTGGHNQPFPTRSQTLSRRTCERQVPGDESDGRYVLGLVATSLVAPA